MMNLKESGSWNEVGPHNTIGVAMEDLPEAERRVLEKELGEEMVKVSRRKLTLLLTQGLRSQYTSHGVRVFLMVLFLAYFSLLHSLTLLLTQG
jgi:hypothetical protein